MGDRKEKLALYFQRLCAAREAGQTASLLSRHLTPAVFHQLMDKRTPMGSDLLDVIQSGVENLDSGTGVYAPDAAAYTVFAPLLYPIIAEYHGFDLSKNHPPCDFGDVTQLRDCDPEGKYVVSTRIRCGRSLADFPLNPSMTKQHYSALEALVSKQLKELEGELAGDYYPLLGMTKQVQNQLIEDHFLFKEGDRFLQSAKACEHWPVGRGIFHNKNKTFLVWVCEEDHLRIISMQKGGNIREVFSRLIQGVRKIEEKAKFSHDEKFGFLTFCPTNLGTTIRASVHIKLPLLSADYATLEAAAGRFNLQVRGTAGEHSASRGGVYDISNKRRLGLTEFEAVREMQEGVTELIRMERQLELKS